MFLLYPSRDFDIAITITYVVFIQRELTVSTALVFAFSHHPRLEGGFLLVHIELSASCKAAFCPLHGRLGTDVSCPYRKALRLLPMSAVPKVRVFYTQARLSEGRFTWHLELTQFKGRAVRTVVERLGGICTRYVLHSSL